ncbi:Carbohydrate kinase PfkB [Moorella glycerini]|uniref:2-dehydro-3-deoxygluconokinase n=1 Tax=Neomoorella stamsii TaxID=1266720 RepID=A0A9X7J367_9FIRM|nr:MULTISPECIES: carbohydrate kinase [Moorella]PRR72615.1 2-dehydro-3-deoxygluconokinase [Moorella stamsii]CEP67771.1 Carbohydrate kinase PfkB [Moorella glycerini]
MQTKNLDVVSIGEILIDFVGSPKGRPLAEATDFRRAAGGGPANVAVGVARLGGRTGFIGKVGRDAFGDHLEQILEENGVDTRGLLRDDEANTTLVFVALNEKAVPEFVFFRHGTADTRLDPAELPQEVLEDTRILHFSSVSLTVEPARGATLEAVRLARAAGAIISFDPNLRLSLWPDAVKARQEILAAMKLADVVKLNKEELRFLLGTEAETVAAGVTALLARGPRLVAVTLGEDGALLAGIESKVRLPAFPVQAVDTTGAGDAFMAGMLVVLAEAIQQGEDLEALDSAWLERLGSWGNAAAALTCTRPGVIPALPAKEEVAKLAT